jgi:acyl-CoA thioesterase-1
VSLLEKRLDGEGYGYEVVNASIAGDTSAGGRARLPQLLARHQPGIVVIELGGNDGLRGQPVDSLRENLSEMIQLSRAAGARVVLTGIQIPPNYGPDYTKALASVYPALANRYDVPLVDFLLEGVALHPELMQRDRIHPNAEGQAVLFDNVWNVLEPLL